jgi:Mn-dependent DtxR family transcriptional regulator
MAKMLGVRRSSISIAAREIKLKRYINYTRGQISLTNGPALEILSNS